MAQHADIPRTVKRVPLVASILIVLLLLGAAGLVVWSTQFTVVPIRDEFQKSLAKDARYNMAWTGLQPLDRFLKVVHLIFTRYFLLENLHFWFLEVWMMPCMALIFFQSIDFDRLSMRLVPLYMFFYQYVGIGICWPLAMIYYLYRRNAHSGRFQGGSTPARVVIVGFSSISSAVVLAALSTLKREGDFYFWMVNVFLLAPVVIPWLTFFISSETAQRSLPESGRGQRYENLVYSFIAGISFLLYWRSVPSMIETYGLSIDGLQKMAFSLASNPVQQFLLFDCLASAIVIVLFLLMDGGFVSSLLTLLASPLISPGAAVSIYLLRRESIIYGTSTGTWSTKVNSPPSDKKNK